MPRGVILAALALSGHVWLAFAQRDQTDVLRLGDAFPRLSGQTLAGKPIDIPERALQKFRLVIFSFSRTGGKDAQRWNQRMSAAEDTHDPTDVLLVLEMEAVPRLMRGLIVFGIKKGVPPSVRDQMLVLDKDDEVWKRRLTVTTNSRSYVVLLAPNGRIKWMSVGPYSEEAFAELRNTMSGR